MADLLPSDPDIEPASGEPRVLGVDDDDADDVLGALSSATARELLSALHEEPAPPSRLAERADTSIQNAQYHIENLHEADLIEKRGTQYSEKGREMTVYGPTDEPLVLFAGDESDSQGLRSALGRFFGAVTVLGAVSLVVQQAVGNEANTTGGGVGTMDATAASGGNGLPPGALVFLGGLVVLGCVAFWTYYRR